MTQPQPKKETTEIPVVTGDLCDKIEKKYGWTQAEKPVYTGVKDLPWNCIFEGTVEFPEAWNEVDDD